jgi:hypothetical protein
VHRRGTHRRYGTDLVAAPTNRDAGSTALCDLLVDPAAQLRCLADLVDRGLISREEFDAVKHRVLQPLR